MRSVFHAAYQDTKNIMLHINDLTYRIEGRLLIDKCNCIAIPAGHKVGLVGPQWRWQIHFAASAHRQTAP